MKRSLAWDVLSEASSVFLLLAPRTIPQAQIGFPVSSSQNSDEGEVSEAFCLGTKFKGVPQIW